MNICTITDCDKPQSARGMCKKHLTRWYRHGDANIVGKSGYKARYTTLQTAFDHWPKIPNDDGCIIWQGNRSGYAPKQYGKLYFNGQKISAHRAAYQLAYGPIRDGYLVDHICQITLCVNPEHLRLATMKQNQEHRSGINSNSTTGVRGVSYDGSKYVARVVHNRREIHVGKFSNLDEAARAVTAARRELFTHNNHDRR